MTINQSFTHACHFTSEQVATISDFSSRLRELYGKGGATIDWWELEQEFQCYQLKEFGRLLYASEIEDIYLNH